jgi:hypothetical protein
VRALPFDRRTDAAPGIESSALPQATCKVVPHVPLKWSPLAGVIHIGELFSYTQNTRFCNCPLAPHAQIQGPGILVDLVSINPLTRPDPDPRQPRGSTPADTRESESQE